MDLNTTWLKFGLGIGVISIIVALCSYYVVPLGGWTQTGISLLLYIIFMVWAAKEQREKNSGFITFGEAFKTVFLTGLVGSVISIFFTLIWMNLVDTSLAEKLAEMALDSSRTMMEKLGADEDVIADAIEKVEEDMEDRFTPLNFMLQGLQGILMGLIPSAIIAAIMKREEKIA